MPLRLYDLGPGSIELANFAGSIGLFCVSSAARRLAETLATDPWWETVGPCALSVTAGDAPRIFMVGELSPADEDRLSAQAAALARGCRRLRYLPMPEVEAAVAELALRLQAEIPLPELARCRFTAIPRGGWIVLGMLAYALGLSTEQLMEARDPTGPTVVVDDRAVSGVRFRQWLRASPAAEVVFAQLLSPPELREAIERNEPRVGRCLAARDLAPVPGSDVEGNPPSAEIEHLRGEQYWWGTTEHVCLPWSEPQRLITGPGGGLEAAWRLMPPDLCLGNRRTQPGIPVHVSGEGAGPWRASPEVVEAELAGRIVLGNRGTGRVLELSVSAGEFWRALLGADRFDGAVEALERIYPGAGPALVEDLGRFAAQLAEQGLLTGPALP